MTSLRLFATCLVAVASAMVCPAGMAQAAPLPDALTLGRDLNGDPCAAGVTYNDPQISAYDRAYVITCRSVSAGRWQGQAMVYSARYTHPKLMEPCAPEQTVTLQDIGPVSARQCYNAALGQPIVMVRFQRKEQVYVGEAVFSALAPMETALLTLSGVSKPVNDRYFVRDASFDPRTLPAVSAPGQQTVDTGNAFNPYVVLRSGIQSNQEGAYVEASRTLNGALSRLDAGIPAATRAEFELEAALADSNIGQKASADAHFAAADALLADGKTGAVSVFLQRKESTYRALDATNRRQWSEVLTDLRAGETTGNPLNDPAMRSALNQSRPPDQGEVRPGAETSLVDRGELRGELLEAQRYWAAGVAWWALASDRTVNSDTLSTIPDTQPCPLKAPARGAGHSAATGARALYFERSAVALDCGVELVNVLQRNVAPGALLPIKSRIQRQYGRLQVNEGLATDARRSFDCALALLQGGQDLKDGGCVFSLAGAQSDAQAPGNFAGPIIAATELERASLLSRDRNLSTAEKIKAFSAAIDSLLVSGGGGESQPADLERYFDLLVTSYAANPSPATAELYFRAIQSVGEPEVARQIAQLQTVVTADSTMAARVRDRAELQRRVIQLRYQLANSGAMNAADRGALEADQRKTEALLDQANLDLNADRHFSSTDDQPVKVSEIRTVLKSGEYYLKVTILKSKAYGIVVSPNRTWLYTVAAGADDLRGIADQIRRSIRDGSGQLHGFDVRAAYTLYSLITGPAAQDIRISRALIVDPTGPLQNLPASTLVVSRDSVKAYYARIAVNPNDPNLVFDYSRVDFLARRANIYSALSPRSLLISRSLQPTQAHKAFIGFGENAAPPPQASAAGRKISFSGCTMEYASFLEMMAANKPVSAHEIRLAADALGDDAAPEVTGADFTDTGLLASASGGAYLDYKVIHFATHGIPETRLPGGCGTVPPSLITTVAPVAGNAPITSDGFLTFSDVAQMRLDANLVVLSACDTAAGVSNETGRLSGQEESGETLDGLVRAFITAGSRSVLATYWQVPASSDTDRLIQTFYRSGRVYDMGQALSIAQRSLIGSPLTSHPYFWGAYVLIGDGSKSMLADPTAPATAEPPLTTAMH